MLSWFCLVLLIGLSLYFNHLSFQSMENGPHGHLGPHAILIVFISGDEHVTTHIQPTVADTVLAVTLTQPTVRMECVEVSYNG